MQAQDITDNLAASRASTFASAIIAGAQKAIAADHANQDSFFVPSDGSEDRYDGMDLDEPFQAEDDVGVAEMVEADLEDGEIPTDEDGIVHLVAHEAPLGSSKSSTDIPYGLQASYMMQSILDNDLEE